MSDTGKIDLLRYPNSLKKWDIVGINFIPASATKIIEGSSSTARDRVSMDKFKVSEDKPSYRAFVLDIVYDTQHEDKIEGLVLEVIRPCDRSIHVENDPKNLMVTNARQLRNMGLDPDKKWRINHTPFYLRVTKGNFGMAEDAMISKYGAVPHDLNTVLKDHIERLGDLQILNTMGIMAGKTLSRSQGRRDDPHVKIVSTRIGDPRLGLTGSQDDLAIIEAAAARKVADQKTGRLEKAKAELDTQKSIPSGKLAYKHTLRFNEKANPDINLEKAFDLALIDEDQFLVLEELGKESGLSTLRTIYDAFINHHAKIQTDLVKLGACEEEDVVRYKAETEDKLKKSLIGFYELYKKTSPQQKSDLPIVMYASPEEPGVK